MALTSNVLDVGGTEVQIAPTTATNVTIKNLGSGIILLGITGAGNQKYPLYGGEKVSFGATALGANAFAISSDGGTHKVAVIYI